MNSPSPARGAGLFAQQLFQFQVRIYPLPGRGCPAAGGAPRSDSRISMLAGGKHTYSIGCGMREIMWDVVNTKTYEDFT